MTEKENIDTMPKVGANVFTKQYLTFLSFIAIESKENEKKAKEVWDLHLNIMDAIQKAKLDPEETLMALSSCVGVIGQVCRIDKLLSDLDGFIRNRSDVSVG